MGASDNVVRGGLTLKAVDVDDLLDGRRSDAARPSRCFRPAPPSTLPGTPISLLVMHGPGARTAVGHELVVTSEGRTGYLPPGATLHVQAGVTAYVASAS